MALVSRVTVNILASVDCLTNNMIRESSSILYVGMTYIVWRSMEENERVAMDKACTDPAVGRAMERLWRKRFT